MRDEVKAIYWIMLHPSMKNMPDELKWFALSPETNEFINKPITQAQYYETNRAMISDGIIEMFLKRAGNE